MFKHFSILFLACLLGISILYRVYQNRAHPYDIKKMDHQNDPRNVVGYANFSEADKRLQSMNTSDYVGKIKIKNETPGALAVELFSNKRHLIGLVIEDEPAFYPQGKASVKSLDLFLKLQELAKQRIQEFGTVVLAVRNLENYHTVIVGNTEQILYTSINEGPYVVVPYFSELIKDDG